MNNDTNTIWIFAYRYRNEFVAETAYLNYEDALDGMELIDLDNDGYQLWKYPEGEIYAVQAEYDSISDSISKTLSSDEWHPILKKVGNDVEKVSDAVKMLNV